MIAELAGSALLSAAQAVADTATDAATETGGEQIAFWILAPLALLGAVGMVLSRGAVHSALWLVLTMLCLGCLYITQDAQFLGFVQIIVYTGAIMMLFLFVLMLTGRDAGDSIFEPLRGQRMIATVIGIAFVTLVVTGLLRALDVTPTVGLRGRAGRPRRHRFDRRGAVHRLPVPVRADQRAADRRGHRRHGADPHRAGTR